VVGLERRREHLRRVDTQAGKQLRVRAGDAGRRAAQAVAVGILADRDQDLADGRLDAGEVDRLGDVVPAEPTVDQPRREMVQLNVELAGGFTGESVELVPIGLSATGVAQ
jgi:hypothetical protein